LALNKLLKGEPSFTCNLGTGLGFSVLEVVKQIKVHYPKFEFVIEPRRAGDPDSLVANVTFSESYLKPNYRQSDLNTILETALAWELRDYDNFQ
jgi:UDP-glucose 4-epimerase